MRTSNLLLLALSAAAFAAEDVSSSSSSSSSSDSPSTTSDSVPASPSITPPPTVTVSQPPPSESSGSSERLEGREIVPGAAVAAPTVFSQVDSVTTLWMPTTLKDGDVVTVPVTYTQTFADVPDQWPQPSSGTIGLGTLTEEGEVPITHTVEARDVKETGALKARSEGTLGQTPWIGMAVGLTCTALAAVMLG